MPGVVALTEAEREALVEQVLAGMAQGKTLQETVEERNWQVAGAKYGKPGCILPGTVREWVVGKEAWFVRYQKTRRLMGQAFAEEAIHVARKSTTNTTATDRVLIETLKWAVEHQGSPVLQVKIVEDDAPVRNEQALKAGMGVAITAAEPLLLSAPVYLPDSGKPGDETGDIDWDAPEQAPSAAPAAKKQRKRQGKG